MEESGRAAIRKVLEKPSWFREHPHYWASASFHFAYAMPCVEVVSRSSEKAAAIYNEIVEAWGEPGIKAVCEDIVSEVPEFERERVKQALLHPESELLPDPNKPFKNLEKLFTGLEVSEDFFKAEETARLERLISEFIIVGFNRESDIAKGRLRVFPSEKNVWLILAVVMRTAFEHTDITLEKIRNFYKLRKYKGEVVDFHKVLTEEPMSRKHRRIVASSKAVNLKLKNDKTIVKAARRWYQCRIVYPRISEFCDSESEKEIILEPNNVAKQIRPCDDAVGYIRRLRRRTSK